MDTFFRSVANEGSEMGMGRTHREQVATEDGQDWWPLRRHVAPLRHRPDNSTLAPRRLHRRATRAARRSG